MHLRQMKIGAADKVTKETTLTLNKGRRKAMDKTKDGIQGPNPIKVNEISITPFTLMDLH